MFDILRDTVETYRVDVQLMNEILLDFVLWLILLFLVRFPVMIHCEK